MAKSKPKTGERRKTRQPFHIDKLPGESREAIAYLYTIAGKTWADIEEQSALRYAADWKSKGGGFVNWTDLPLSVLELFPDMKIPRSNLQRWFDVRYEQAAEAAMQRSEHAMRMAEAFVGRSVKGDKEAVLHAARDIFFGIMSEDGSLPARVGAGKALLALSREQQKARLNDIRERQITADERKLKLLEDREKLTIQKLEAETDRLAKKAKTGQPITVEELQAVRMKAFGF